MGFTKFLHVKEFAELQQDLQASEREKNEVEQHLMRCRADLRKAEDTVMIEQGMRQRVSL